MPTVEHRNNPRVRSFLRGEIVHSHDASRTECTIRDMSEGGARIEAPPSVTVPEFFDLVIPQRGTRQRARIVWRHGPELGISFQDMQAPPAPVEAKPFDVKRRVLELEVEIAKLRVQLVAMQDVVESLVQEKHSA